eukprot:2228152-Amphidinium_carterae.1
MEFPTDTAGGSAASSSASRVAFDDFQKKWDRFDSDEYISKLVRDGAARQASLSAEKALQLRQLRPEAP